MSFRAKNILLVATAATVFVGTAGTAWADAFYLEAQSARGAGRAFSGEAADTGADSLWWNPAAIAGIRNGSATLAASAILPKGDVVNTNTLIVRPGQPAAAVGGEQVSRDPINNGVVPSGSFAFPISDRIAIGLAVTAPYNFTTQYGATSWARYSADKTRLRTVDIQPSIGIALTDWLRVGGAVNVEYADATLSNKLPNLLATLPDGEQTLTGDGWDVGYTAGLQMHNDTVTVGLSYKSSIKHTLKGNLVVAGLLGPLAASNVTIDGATASFRTPSQMIAAVRVNVTPKLTLDAQGVRYRWDLFDAITLGAPLNTKVPENYRNSWSLAGGADYALGEKTTVRAGVQRVITPTQDGLRDARVPDANRWVYAVGGSHQLTRRFAVDLAASYIDFADSSIDRTTAAFAGTAVQTPILVNGTLQNAHAVVLSAGGRFSF